ncbi:MAG TPA: peptidylprolyl isomerase [Vicinamibacterales bacterium]|nr:peptidylprolyl isomerase [Vicinamibacterales bacterium]
MTLARIAFAAILALVASGMVTVARTDPQAPGSARGIEATADSFSCGKDAEILTIPVRWGTVVLAGDARLYMPCPAGVHKAAPPNMGLADREIREAELLRAALRSITDGESRWRAAQAYARLGMGPGMVYPTALVNPACNAEAQIFGGIVNPMRWQPGELFMMLRNGDPRVRREIAYGITVAVSRPNVEQNVATASRKEIAACLLSERMPDVRQFLIEAIGVAHYGTDEDRAEAAAYLVERSRSATLQDVLGAVKGLEALIRQSAGGEVAESVRIQLRDLLTRERPNVAPAQVELAARIRRLAMAALQAARDADVATFDRASLDRDWQVRRLVAMMLDLSNPAQARIGERLSEDSEFQVRYDYLSSLSRLVTQTRTCAPLLKYVDDAQPLVAMRAMDLLSARCTDLEKSIDRLMQDAVFITRGESHVEWHKPSRAMVALARLRPEEAKKLMPAAVAHPAWQVRAQAAASAVLIGMPEVAATLAGDRVPNVQTAAIDALARAKDAAVFEPAIAVLRTGTDFQVLRAAANAMNGVPAELHDYAVTALVAAMRRLIDLGEDPSRDPKVAILAALGRVGPGNHINELTAFMVEVDDVVNEAAQDAFKATGGFAAPGYAAKRRYPFQPSEAALNSLPSTAIIELETGAVTIELLPAEAPVTIARFAALVKAGYYNGLTFHRIVPNFVVQGGSPGANEYVGNARFMRDEVSPSPHIRGAVGISTRGRDTGDGQIFIDLVDLPRLDRDYTVFGYVRSGMQFVDRMLEGTVIRSVTVK